MLLAVDIGNTHTVIGVFDEGKLLCHFRMATAVEATEDELRVLLLALIRAEGIDLDDIDSLVVASVVPELTESWERVGQRLETDTLVVTGQLDTGLKLDYPRPSEIGADRLADAVAAIELYGSPVIIVDLGTATNIEVIDRKGAFIGGIIAPGLATGADALFEAAARLPRLDLEAPDHVIGDNTQHAVQSGLIYGEVCRIDGLVQMIEEELGYEATVVATGGLSPLIAPFSKSMGITNIDLTLQGLNIIYNRCR